MENEHQEQIANAIFNMSLILCHLRFSTIGIRFKNYAAKILNVLKYCKLSRKKTYRLLRAMTGGGRLIFKPFSTLFQ